MLPPPAPPRAKRRASRRGLRSYRLSHDVALGQAGEEELFEVGTHRFQPDLVQNLDDEAVFYLRSRGIGEEAARSLLTYSFAGEVLDEIRLEAVRADLEEFLFTRLPKGDIVRQAV